MVLADEPLLTGTITVLFHLFFLFINMYSNNKNCILIELVSLYSFIIYYVSLYSLNFNGISEYEKLLKTEVKFVFMAFDVSTVLQKTCATNL